MSRTAQPAGRKGSLRWIQRAIADPNQDLTSAIEARLKAPVVWKSPLKSDGFAEYRDGDFLDLVGLDAHRQALATFWPARGPQWDALGVSRQGDILLVEAKAHVAEMCSPGTAASAASRSRIEAALTWAAERLKAKPRAPWSGLFYQYANRLAHLAFLRDRGVPAWLVLVSFISDAEMGGPATAEAWSAAYDVVHHVMGLRSDHPLARYVIHLHPDVQVLTAPW